MPTCSLAASIDTITGCVYTASVAAVASIVNPAACSGHVGQVLNMVGNKLRMDRRRRAQVRGYHLGQGVLIHLNPGAMIASGTRMTFSYGSRWAQMLGFATCGGDR
jgi:hypothetical protein